MSTSFRKKEIVRFLRHGINDEIPFASREYIDRLVSDPIYGSNRNRFLNWLQTTVDGHNYTIKYVAMTYYDKFLSATPACHDDFPLLCLACYGDAALLYGSRLPTITAIFDEEFTHAQIRRASASLSNSLYRKMLLLTPLDFLSYFCLNMYETSYLSKARDYVMESMAMTSLLYYRPSMIAAAAVMAAHTAIKQSRISRDDVVEKLNTVTEVGRIDVDAVFSCYLRMVNWRNQRDTFLESCVSTNAVSFPPEMEMYQVLNEIGSCRRVFKVRDMNTFEMFAVKEILIGHPDVQLSVSREVIILIKLQEHPQIVKLREFFDTEKGVYLVMDLLDQNLAERISLYPISTDERKTFVKQILMAVAYCHEKGVLHRDLKMENFLVDSERNELKLAGFGSASQFEIPGTALPPCVGTHCAPELLLGSTSYKTANDIWSVGCIFAQLAKGQVLFRDHDEDRQKDEQGEVQKLRMIFSVMGTPDEEVFPGITNFIERNEIPKFSPKDLKDEFPDLEPSGLDLLRRMLCLDPRRRISAIEAVKHPYVKDFGYNMIWHGSKNVYF